MSWWEIGNKGFRVLGRIGHHTYKAMFERPTCWICLVAVANFRARGREEKGGLETWFEKFLRKKFQDSWPLTENMATRFPESTPSLRHLRPNPGLVFLTRGSGSVVRLILMTQCSAPLNTPVKGGPPTALHSTEPVTPTAWMNFFLRW